MSDHIHTQFDTPAVITCMGILAIVLGLGELIYGVLHFSTGPGSFTDGHYSFRYRGYLIDMPLWARFALPLSGVFSLLGGYLLLKRKIVTLVPLAFALIAIGAFVLDAVFRNAFDEDTGVGIVFALSVLGALAAHFILFIFANRWMSRGLIR